MKKERIFWGLFFIVAAVFMIVNRLGFFDFTISYISVLLSIFVIAWLIKGIIRRDPVRILFSLAFLCILYRQPLHLEAITPLPVLGAALLGSIGFSFLRGNHYSNCGGHWDSKYSHVEESTEYFDGDEIQFTTSFAGSIKYVKSDDFKRANLKCSFGSMKVYFDNAALQGDNALITVDVSFAGMELYIPKEWNVVNKVDCSFGAVDEKNRNSSSGQPTVLLTGKVSFSGVEIVYI